MKGDLVIKKYIKKNVQDKEYCTLPISYKYCVKQKILFADYYDDFFGYEDYDYYGGGYAPQMPRGRGGRGGPPVSI